MVNGVKVPELLIHQALHGYADGHRQLSISVELKPQDSKTLMTLSDSSGPGVRFPDTGYLTGYPLLESGYYVLARTWPAPEMPRPGCVWTHSLLIDFADLATLLETGDLLHLFRRPSADVYTTYNSKVVYNFASRYGVKARSVAGAERLLSALYDQPKSRVISSGTSALDEQLILDIWCQQWPRLRRNFRFCTCSATDRSTKAATFDLQLLPSEARTIRSRFVELLDADLQPVTPALWLREALNDLAWPDKSGLRTFLRQLGADISFGREGFPFLCRLHKLLTQEIDSASSVAEAIRLFESQFSSGQGRAARNAIIRALLTNVHLLDDVAFEFLLSNFDSVLTNSDESEVQRLGEELWKAEPHLLAQIFSRPDAASRELVEKTIARLPLENLAKQVGAVPSLFELIIRTRPDIVGEHNFWTDLGKPAIAALNHAGRDKATSLAAAKALVEARRYDLADYAFEILGDSAVGAAVLSAPYSMVDDIWFAPLSRRPKTVLKLLCSNTQFQRHSLVLLAAHMRVNEVPDVSDRDPWFAAWLNGTGDVVRTDQSFFFAYLMARALSGNQHAAVEVMVHTFHFLHAALEQNEVSQSAWAVLEWRLPYGVYQNDSCVRLRAGVVWRFIYHTLSAESFLQLTPDDNLFVSLVESAAASSRGRRYLKLVLEAARASGERKNLRRYSLIKSIM